MTGIDYAQQVIVLVDPYKEFVDEERIIDIYKFMNRWWDTNDVSDPVTKEKKRVRDEKLLFVVSRRNPQLMEKLGMKIYY